MKVWLRKSSNFAGVGAKPQTICRFAVSSIDQDTQMEHKFLGFWLPAGHPFGAYDTNTRRLVQKDVALRCNGNGLTMWRAITTGVVIFRGRVFETRVSTDEIELRCSY